MISGRYSEITHLSPKSKYVLDPGKGSDQLKKLRNRKGYQTVEEIHVILSSISKSRKKVPFEILAEILNEIFLSLVAQSCFFSFTHLKNL